MANRSDFDETRSVRLLQAVYKNGRALTPGVYEPHELPDLAFEIGIVQQDPVPANPPLKLKIGKASLPTPSDEVTKE